MNSSDNVVNVNNRKLINNSVSFKYPEWKFILKLKLPKKYI